MNMQLMRWIFNYEGIQCYCLCRTTAATNMNDCSSRSHAIFTISFTQVLFISFQLLRYCRNLCLDSQDDKYSLLALYNRMANDWRLPRRMFPIPFILHHSHQFFFEFQAKFNENEPCEMYSNINLVDLAGRWVNASKYFEWLTLSQ